MSLIESQAPSDPIELFSEWQLLSKETERFEGTAMALATVDASGMPSVRMVLLKDFGQNGFTFFTNFGSRKAADLADNPRASLMFWWPSMNRQVRIEGTVSKIDNKDSDAYFSTRPRLSQISTWASEQSKVIENRKILVESMDHLIRKFGEGSIPRPDYWGGYRLKHDAIEFWANRDNRLHDRILYSRDKDSWRIERLAP
ncbi:MAG: pyridoxamine 5'-phosphate oxidase [Gammaproteobacteria bacterium]